MLAGPWASGLLIPLTLGLIQPKVVLTAEQATALAEKQIAVDYPTFASFTIHNLFEFFMVFVILCGIAAILLALLTPMLKKMMHGIR